MIVLFLLELGDELVSVPGDVLMQELEAVLLALGVGRAHHPHRVLESLGHLAKGIDHAHGQVAPGWRCPVAARRLTT